ncbi:MAG TPA: hypothetical protein VFU89_02300 [Rhabdochlamydiaceae bacterium]|nr:hypothetical protein [Rhabdochlamydiaceae bacterium]
MKRLQLALVALCLMSVAFAEDAVKEIAAPAPMDCSNMSADVQQFSSQLNAMNKKMFCGQFTADQRSTAMQYASQQDANGMTMTPDRAVQKVGAENKMTPSARSPTGCPIK